MFQPHLPLLFETIGSWRFPLGSFSPSSHSLTLWGLIIVIVIVIVAIVIVIVLTVDMSSSSLLSWLFHRILVILITSKAWSKHGNLESWWVGWRNRTRRWTLPENYFDHHSGRDHDYLDHHGYLRSTMMMMIIIIIVIMIVMLFMRNWLIVSHNLWQSWRWGELDFYLRNLCSLFMMILPPSSPLPTCRNQKYKSWKLIGVQDHQKPHTGR